MQGSDGRVDARVIEHDVADLVFHEGANEEARHAKAELVKALGRKVVVVKRGGRDVIVKAAMFVVGHEQHQARPLRRRAQRRVDRLDENLTGQRMRRRMIVAAAKDRVDNDDSGRGILSADDER